MPEVNQTAQITKYLYAKCARLRLPVSGTFELTPRCNMNCRMCYIRMSESEMQARGREITARQWIGMGEQCVSAGMMYLLFTGGEPFLLPYFGEIYTAIVKMGVVPTINSNATLVGREQIAWLAQNPPSKVNVTLYGGSSETYARLCRNPQGFEQATAGILRMLDAGIPVGLNASLTRENKTDLEAILEFSQKYNLKIRHTAYMFPPMRSAKEGKIDADMDAARFSPEEAGRMMAMTLRCKLNPEEFRAAQDRARAGRFTIPEDGADCSRNQGEGMGCHAGKSSFWITWDGRMTPCGMMNAPVTYPFDTGFAAAWEKLHRQTDQICLPPACTGCTMRSACVVCGAVALAEGAGDSRKRPDYVCKMMETYLKTLAMGESPEELKC